MNQIPKPVNNLKENKSAFDTPPFSAMPPNSSLPKSVASSAQSAAPASKPVVSPIPSAQPYIPPVKPAIVFAEPISQISPIIDKSSKPAANASAMNTGQKFTLAPAEVQGPKPPLVSGSGSKFALIAIGASLIIIVGVVGYYFYAKDTSSQPAASPVATVPASTPAADKNMDSDKDGLPDAIEAIVGTNPNNVDSDGDIFTDLNEIKNGYSPLIAGAAGKYTQEERDNVNGKIKIENREFYKREFEMPATSQSPSSSPAASKLPN